MVSGVRIDPMASSNGATVHSMEDPALLSLVSSPTIKKHSFAAISKKLDSEKYLLWCQQVEPVIKAHKLH